MSVLLVGRSVTSFRQISLKSGQLHFQVLIYISQSKTSRDLHSFKLNALLSKNFLQFSPIDYFFCLAPTKNSAGHLFSFCFYDIYSPLLLFVCLTFHSIKVICIVINILMLFRLASPLAAGHTQLGCPKIYRSEAHLPTFIVCPFIRVSLSSTFCFLEHLFL